LTSNWDISKYQRGIIINSYKYFSLINSFSSHDGDGLSNIYLGDKIIMFFL
jgi:hypothetical protein